MANLKERLGGGEKRGQVIDDACEVLDREVSEKSGITGLAVKAGYAVVKGVKPGFIRQAVDFLLDEFLEALDPFCQKALEAQQRPGSYLLAHGDEAADALLGVTDRRAQRAESGILRKTYDKLRPTAKKHVQAAVPRLAQLLDKHVT